ncbi:probable G-protein coupled receptor Mth-like 14 isoform X5 [Drosophila eugracilis]|uniref:probable G-protein coupled receptor Mth-like 14 isoform X5 n=1 Tax=Drosophila eugracilis TaxID=29029 RepID=UPI0007E7AFEA|nr:probable G-protein coupled receptor Mth-like 14 isoform X5 [Drosophila eugracilis]
MIVVLRNSHCDTSALGSVFSKSNLYNSRLAKIEINMNIILALVLIGLKAISKTSSQTITGLDQFNESNHTRDIFNNTSTDAWEAIITSSPVVNKTRLTDTTITTGSTFLSFLPVQSSLEKLSDPADCSQREKYRKQPIAKQSSRLRKCCPHGENLDIYRENQSDSMCDNGMLKFEPTIISAVLFDNCIEDLEIETKLDYDIGNPCNSSLQYDNQEDVFFVLQDGSLLIIDKFGNESYTVEENYCLDIDKSGNMFAFTCVTQVEEQIAFAKVLFVAVLMLLSMPCLLLVSYLHMTLRLLRNLHGLSLSLMSLCLASGYFVHSVVHIYGIPNQVSLTIQKGLPGMPSYFLQGLTESIRDSQRYFIPPVSTILFLSFLINIISFFGFQRLNGYEKAEKSNDDRRNLLFDQQKFEDVKKDAKCVSLLGIIMVISWLLEIVTFYSGSNSNYLLICDMVNGLQGVWVLLIFLVVRRRRTIILRWWYDRGSHEIEETELQALSNRNNIT